MKSEERKKEMKRLNFKAITSLVLVITLLMGAFATIGVCAAVAPTVEICYKNVEFGGTLKLMYAVSSENLSLGDEVRVVICDENGNVIENTTKKSAPETINGAEYDVFVSDRGVAMHNMDTYLYAKAQVVNGGNVVAESATVRYSSLEYVWARLSDDEVPANEKTMLNNLLNYAGSADVFFNNAEAGKTVSDYVYVTANGGTFEGGLNSGVYLPGTKLTGFATDMVAGSGKVLNWIVGSVVNGSTSKVAYTTEEIAEGITVEGPTTIEVIEVDSGVKIETTLATFQFEGSGKSGHQDGSDLGASKSYSNNGYTLALTGMSKVFGKSNDAKGNTAIKLGTSSVVGTFKFTVGENVTKVVIAVAKYKSNTTKITINGTAYTVPTNSDNGEYTLYEIDTTSTKTITFATVSGGARCMIDYITFIGYES